MISLSSEDLIELLRTRIFASHFLYLFNFDFVFLDSLYEEIGLNSADRKLKAAIQSGGDIAIPTTYAYDGYGSTRLDRPLIYNQKTKRFDLQISFRIPVEAVVVETDHVPQHIANNPFGFGFVGGQATEESEITFIDAITPEWIATDWQQLSDIFYSGMFPREIISSNPDTY